MVNITKATVAIIGLGYVGLPLALLVAKKGFKVIGIDTDTLKVARLQKEERYKQNPIEVTQEQKRLGAASIFIVCVPTPVDAFHAPDLTLIEDAVAKVGKNMKKGSLVIIESTINPGACEAVIIPFLEKASGLICGRDFYLSHCPERINPGDKKWTVQNIPRVVGSFNQAGLEKTVAFYESILEGKVMPMRSLKEAEAVKIVENSFRDINIAFANELARSFSHLGIDVVNVIDGAATKPFAFLAHYPSCGVGGHCIPVDPYYLIDYAKRNGFNHQFLSLAREINNDMPSFTVSLTEELLREKQIPLHDATVAVLGLAYKPGIEDCRESPALKIIDELKKRGANVVTYDPYVKAQSTASDVSEAIYDADAVIVATAHEDFKRLPPEFFIEHNVDALVDGQNCLPEKEFIKAGIMYQGIGKHHIYLYQYDTQH